MAIHPAIAQATEQITRIIQPRGTTPDLWRAQAFRADREVTMPRMRPAPSCLVEDVIVPVPGLDPVRVRLYFPADRKPGGALLHFFGGAFRQGGVEFPSTDITNRSRAARAGVVIAAVDYALAPESRFPLPIRQGLAALSWLAGHADRLGFPSRSIAIGGLSAGGNIAAAVALANRDEEGHDLQFQLLEVPVLDLTGAHFDREICGDLGLSWTALEPDLLAMARLYLEEADPTNPLASPLLSPRLDGLPPAHVFTAELDVFRGDGSAFVDALVSSGGVAREHRYAGMTHDSHFFSNELPAAAQWQEHVVRLLGTIGGESAPHRSAPSSTDTPEATR
jgi:acetyl esterase